MKSVSDEIKFLMNAYEKKKSESTFWERVHELYLEGEISTDAYEAIKLIYNKTKITTTTASPVKPSTTSVSSPCGGGRQSFGRC